MIGLAGVGLAISLNSLPFTCHHLIFIKVAVATKVPRRVKEFSHVASTKIGAGWLTAMQAPLTFLEFKLRRRSRIPKRFVRACSPHCRCVLLSCGVLCTYSNDTTLFRSPLYSFDDINFFRYREVLLHAIQTCAHAQAIHEGQRLDVWPSPVYNMKIEFLPL